MRHNHVPRQKARPPAFRKRDIHQRHDRPAQIENPHQKCRRKRNVRQFRPVHDFFHFQHRKAKSLPPGAKHAVLASRAGALRLARHSRRHQIPAALLSRAAVVEAHANFFTALNQFSGRERLAHVPFAPCCSPQYLSLAEFFELTRITGIAAKRGVVFQLTANLKSISPGHHHIEQNQVRPLVLDGFFDASRDRSAQPCGSRLARARFPSASIPTAESSTTSTFFSTGLSPREIHEERMQVESHAARPRRISVTNRNMLIFSMDYKAQEALERV